MSDRGFGEGKSMEKIDGISNRDETMTKPWKDTMELMKQIKASRQHWSRALCLFRQGKKRGIIPDNRLYR